MCVCVCGIDMHVSALKTKLNQKHCLKFMWSIDYGLAIVNRWGRVVVVRKADNVFIDLLMNFKYLKYIYIRCWRSYNEKVN